MGDYISGGIYFSGLGNGTDFSTMVDQLKKVESIPKARMELWRDDWQKRTDAFDVLLGQIKDYQKTVSGMSEMSSFMKRTASSSSSGVADAKATSGAAEGVHSIDVTALASNAVWIFNNPFDSKTTKVNTSTTDVQKFTYEYKGKERSLSVPPGTTLEGLVNTINKDAENPGVRASLIKNGDKFSFQLQGNESGESATLKVSDTTTVGGFGNLADWNKRDPTSCEYTLNNWPTSFKSNSNTITDVIDGVTITLKGKGSTNITIATDTEGIKKNVKDLVDGMNTLRKSIQDMTKFDDNKKTTDTNLSLFNGQKGSVLTGNYGVQLLAGRLKNITASAPPGFQGMEGDGFNRDALTLLGQVGIATAAGESDPNFGLLTIDEEALDKALAKDPTGVAELFAANNMGETNSTDFRFTSALNSKPGVYDVEYDVAADGTINNVLIGGVKANMSDLGVNRFTAGSDSPASGIAIELDNLTPGKHQGKLRLKEGKAGEITRLLNNELKDDKVERNSGSLVLLKDNYSLIMDNIDKKIESEEKRLTTWERRMRLQFSRLEATLKKYEGVQATLDSQMSMLAQ